jgi:hypothetical protein
MINNHTLAANIITSHNTPTPLLNKDQFSLLQRFSLDPNSIPKSLLLESTGIDPSALTPSELTLLQEFFKALDIDISPGTGAGPMLRSHTLAYNLILRPHEIFDAASEGSPFCINFVSI